jgi:hypothetical protein
MGEEWGCQTDPSGCVELNFFFRVKYIFAPCSLKTLFFVSLVFIFFIGGTCAMEKDGDSTSVHFSVQN